MLSIYRVGFLISFALGLFVITMIGLAPIVNNQSQKTKNEDAREAIMEVLKAHSEYWNRHDIDTWADKLLHEDSDWVNWRGGYWHGKAAIKAGIQAIHKTFYKSSQMTPHRVEDLTFLSPESALVHARSELSGDERSPGVTIQYRKTILFTKQNGVWRIRALHNTRLMDAE
jgi:uncharacterized protein (TIGR02246 family)